MEGIEEGKETAKIQVVIWKVLLRKSKQSSTEGKNDKAR